MIRNPMHLFAAALLLVAGNFLVPVLAGDKDKTPVEGAWKGGDGDHEMFFQFTGSKWSLKINKGGQDFMLAGTFKLDPKQNPKTMDLEIKEAPDELQKFKDQVAKCIYDLDGDKLKWCANQPGKEERPTAFPGQVGESNGLLYIVLDRQKK